MFFLFLFWLCPVLESRIFCFGLSFDFFVFCSVSKKLESGFPKNDLSSFSLDLICSGYRWTFSLSHANSCGFVVLVICVG